MSRRCPSCGTEYPDDTAFCGHDGSVNIQVQPEGDEKDPRLGEKLGNYIVAAHIADGAMGAVYEARNAETRERVAVKVLHADVEEDEIAVERFKREYETADMFDHPHIVKVIDFGETADGQHYMTMEYLEGVELGEILRNDGAQDPARALRICAQVADALDHAHSFGVIHRDLKPDNIFLVRGEGGDDVRILDFGSVKLQVETGPKLTAFGTTLGSPYYMSPEQAKGLPDVDNRTDVFAVGAILYELSSGKIAFEAPTVAEILMKIVRLMPDPLTKVAPQVPPALEQVVVKAIAKKKEERYSTPQELVDDAFAAYGIEGGSAAWAERPQAELSQALATASPKAAAAPAAAAPAAPPTAAAEPAGSPPAAAAPAPTTAAPIAPEAVPGLSSSPLPANKLLLLAAVAGVGLLLLGGLALVIAILL
ncbi:MAG: serine/threonine-protein kinase [Sandaracinaceae bacterium]